MGVWGRGQVLQSFQRWFGKRKQKFNQNLWGLSFAAMADSAFVEIAFRCCTRKHPVVGFLYKKKKNANATVPTIMTTKMRSACLPLTLGTLLYSCSVLCLAPG